MVQAFHLVFELQSGWLEPSVLGFEFVRSKVRELVDAMLLMPLVPRLDQTEVLLEGLEAAQCLDFIGVLTIILLEKCLERVKVWVLVDRSANGDDAKDTSSQ